MEYPTKNQPTPLARQEELVVQELTDEVLVYDLRQHKAHCLNKSAAFIWEQCDGTTSVSELVKRASAEFQSPIDEGMVWQTLDRLGKANLLTEQVKRPVGDGFRSRRAMLGKLGTAAMLSVPLVTTVVAPLAAQTGTLPPQCVCCTSFGSGNNRANNCPSICNSTPGSCYGNASCGTGQGQLLASNIGCSTCYSTYPAASGWRIPSGSSTPCN